MNARVAVHSIDAVVSGADQLGETPLWCDQTRRLWWIDIERPKLQSYDPETGRADSVGLPGMFAGTQALTRGGERLLARDLTLYTRHIQSGAQRDVVTVELGVDNRLNDGRVDARGRFWVGTMDNQLHRANGALYRVDPDGGAVKIESDVVVSNGIAFSPDGRTLYFTDTRRHLSYAYDLDLDDGMVTNRRVLADHTATGDRPDGACVDVDGCIWMAFFAGGRIRNRRSHRSAACHQSDLPVLRRDRPSHALCDERDQIPVPCPACGGAARRFAAGDRGAWAGAARTSIRVRMRRARRVHHGRRTL